MIFSTLRSTPHTNHLIKVEPPQSIDFSSLPVISPDHLGLAVGEARDVCYHRHVPLFPPLPPLLKKLLRSNDLQGDKNTTYFPHQARPESLHDVTLYGSSNSGDHHPHRDLDQGEQGESPPNPVQPVWGGGQPQMKQSVGEWLNSRQCTWILDFSIAGFLPACCRSNENNGKDCWREKSPACLGMKSSQWHCRLYE